MIGIRVPPLDIPEPRSSLISLPNSSGTAAAEAGTTLPMILDDQPMDWGAGSDPLESADDSSSPGSRMPPSWEDDYQSPLFIDWDEYFGY